MSIENNCFLDSIQFKPIPKTPVWLMRQAGRYLPEYLNTRKKAGSFLDLCKNSDLACEVTLQPIERFDLDAAIIFSDILVVLEAIGFDLAFSENVGPQILNPITTTKAVKGLKNQVETELQYVSEAIRKTKTGLKNRVPLIGFAGSPWTLFTYALEGGKAQNGFLKSKKMLFCEPQSSHELLQKITDATSQYLKNQIQSGVDCLMIFDTWGGVLAWDDYQTFSLDCIEEIIQRSKKHSQQFPSSFSLREGGYGLNKLPKSNLMELVWIGQWMWVKPEQNSNPCQNP